MPEQTDPNNSANIFEKEAQKRSSSLFVEMMHFLGTTKKWWLTPLILVLLLIGVLVVLGSTALAPFIYTLF